MDTLPYTCIPGDGYNFILLDHAQSKVFEYGRFGRSLQVAFGDSDGPLLHLFSLLLKDKFTNPSNRHLSISEWIDMMVYTMMDFLKMTGNRFMQST